MSLDTIQIEFYLQRWDSLDKTEVRKETRDF